jgi:hypothetical protein
VVSGYFCLVDRYLFLIKNPFCIPFFRALTRLVRFDRSSLFIQFSLEVGLLPRILPKSSIKLLRRLKSVDVDEIEDIPR